MYYSTSGSFLLVIELLVGALQTPGKSSDTILRESLSFKRKEGREGGREKKDIAVTPYISSLYALSLILF